MTYDPLENLLVSAWKELAQYLPEEASHAALYLELERMSGEIDERGNPTPQAHRAKARLRNAFLVEETNAKSKGKVVKDQAKLEKELGQVVSRALVLLVASRANAARLAHIDSFEERQLPVDKSREQHDPESKFALSKPFIDKLSQAGLSPSEIGRMPAAMVDFIALMIRDHDADPKLQSPDNVWNRIVRSGILEAYLGNLDEDHLKVVAQAGCEREEQTNEWARQARAELDLPAGMDDRFLEGVARMCDAARSLTQGEARAYEDAYKLQDDLDVDRLAKLLRAEDQADRIRLRALVDFVHRAIAPLKRDWKMEMQLGILKREIDAIEPHSNWHQDWKAELREKLEITFERLGPMRSVEAFNALLKSGLAVSEADWEFVKRLERDVLDGHFIALENEVRAACKSGRSFKVYDNRVVYSHEAGFETIEAETWTGYEWLQEYGAWPGEDAEEREADDDVSRASVEDAIEPQDGDEAQTDDGNTPVILFALSATEEPLAEEFQGAQTTSGDRAHGSRARSTSPEPNPANMSASDATYDAPTLRDDHSRASDEPVDDDYNDEDPDDDGWHDEKPDLEPLDLDLGHEFEDDFVSPDRASDDPVPDNLSEPAEARGTGGASQHDVPLQPARPEDQPVRQHPYNPQLDHEEDDWNE